MSVMLHTHTVHVKARPSLGFRVSDDFYLCQAHSNSQVMSSSNPDRKGMYLGHFLWRGEQSVGDVSTHRKEEEEEKKDIKRDVIGSKMPVLKDECICV